MGSYKSNNDLKFGLQTQNRELVGSVVGLALAQLKKPILKKNHYERKKDI